MNTKEYPLWVKLAVVEKWTFRLNAVWSIIIFVLGLGSVFGSMPWGVEMGVICLFMSVWQWVAFFWIARQNKNSMQEK